jgi:hypothetical protein
MLELHVVRAARVLIDDGTGKKDVECDEVKCLPTACRAPRLSERGFRQFRFKSTTRPD